MLSRKKEWGPRILPLISSAAHPHGDSVEISMEAQNCREHSLKSHHPNIQRVAISTVSFIFYIFLLINNSLYEFNALFLFLLNAALFFLFLLVAKNKIISWFISLLNFYMADRIFRTYPISQLELRLRHNQKVQGFRPPK